jgi:D-glycero-D-manno-heptose 1,7-bisphosphate phosphatase
MQRALFLDRDGTLVEPRHYPSRPEDLVLSPDIGPLLRMFQTSGWELVVVTNQSGIARGYFTEHDLECMHDKLREMLRVWGVELSAIAYCPHHVDGAVPHLAIPCTCRKPQPGMLLEIAATRDIDLARSWMIGDILDDIEAGRRAGCRTVLLDNGNETVWRVSPLRTPHVRAADLLEAAQAIVAADAADRPHVQPPMGEFQ